MNLPGKLIDSSDTPLPVRPTRGQNVASALNSAVLLFVFKSTRKPECRRYWLELVIERKETHPDLLVSKPATTSKVAACLSAVALEELIGSTKADPFRV
jgi:hypothetical protein